MQTGQTAACKQGVEALQGFSHRTFTLERACFAGLPCFLGLCLLMEKRLLLLQDDAGLVGGGS